MEKTNSGFKPRSVSARTENQKIYIRSIVENDITICYGPAGSGKTFVAAGMAVQGLKQNRIEKIIICRPVISTGKDIGYLPGTIEDKVGPYLIPLFDELSHFLEKKKLKELMGEGIIEIVPLSMMRGRTFNDSFIILDEAQNAVHCELKMLLTRIGQDSKMVLIGDPCQTDLPDGVKGSFVDIGTRLAHLDGVGVVRLTGDDIVRHELIVEIERLI